MLRLATIIGLVAAVFAALPAPATAAGCEVIRDARERADCVAKAQARAAAQAEVERRTDDAAGDVGSGRSAAWQRAIDESEGIHLDELLDVRLLAAIGGLAWFWFTWRHQRRRRRCV